MNRVVRPHHPGMSTAPVYLRFTHDSPETGSGTSDCVFTTVLVRLGAVKQPSILINRAPVLTVWAATVAERLGFDTDEALSLGKTVAGLTAQSKGRRLGIYKPVPEEIRKARAKERGEEFFVELCGRAVPAINTEDGVRAVTKGRPVEPGGVERYLEAKFGDFLESARNAMRDLANAFRLDELRENAFSLYDVFASFLVRHFR
jgi:hypothetical protein